MHGGLGKVFEPGDLPAGVEIGETELGVAELCEPARFRVGIEAGGGVMPVAMGAELSGLALEGLVVFFLIISGSLSAF